MTFPPQQNSPWAPQQQAPAPQSPSAPAWGQPAAQAPQNSAPAWGQQAPAAAPQAPAQSSAQAAVPTGYSAPAVGGGMRPFKHDLKGRLLLVTPTGLTSGKNQQTGMPYPVVVCDVIVLDGGIVTSNSPKTPGLQYDGHAFSGVWLDGTFLQTQLAGAVGSGQTFLGRLDTKNGGHPGPGNPWGLNEATDADRQRADAFIAGDRSMVVPEGTVAPQAPAQQAPQQPYGQYAQQQQQQQAPAPQAPAWGQQQAPAAPAWGQQAPAQQAPAWGQQG